MNQQERIDLKKLMRTQGSDYEDNTEGIRRLKHSELIASDIKQIEELKANNKEMRTENPQGFLIKCQLKCSFLYNAYTDIFHRLIKDELNLELMGKALILLKNIEDGQLNQQEGSVAMGKILHRIFVESALKQKEHLEEVNSNNETDLENPSIVKTTGQAISWTQYKATQK